jgi:hypothetical protein
VRRTLHASPPRRTRSAETVSTTKAISSSVRIGANGLPDRARTNKSVRRHRERSRARHYWCAVAQHRLIATSRNSASPRYCHTTGGADDAVVCRGEDYALCRFMAAPWRLCP